MLICFKSDIKKNLFSGEKKKTKAVNNELNPVWNEVSEGFTELIS